MRRSREKEWSNEDVDTWLVASDRNEAVAATADELGGPRLSLVAVDDRASPWPTDLLPGPSATAEQADAEPIAPADTTVEPDTTVDRRVDATATEPAAAQPFDGVALPDSRKRLAGWSADRQRLFLATLAETGSVHLAASEARLSARGAYRLRARSADFATAWDTAEQLAVGRLSALAFDRAINGRIEQMWHGGELVAEKRLPSDRLLMWLLARLDPRRFAAPGEVRRDGAPDPQATARTAFPVQLDALPDFPAD